jgi:hypothetical protein
MREDEFAWVRVDATGILGSARPTDVAGLLRKPELWHRLYRDWLAHFHPDHGAGFAFVEKGRPRLHGRDRYDEWVAALDAHFDAFHADVGDLKQALDPRSGTSRRLAHLTGRAADAVRDAAGSRVATGVADTVGGRGLRELAVGAAGRVGTAVGPQGPQSTAGPPPPAADVPSSRPAGPAPPRPPRRTRSATSAAAAFAESSDLDVYLQWLVKLAADLSWYGGLLGRTGEHLTGLAPDVVAWRQELRDRVAAEDDDGRLHEAAYWLHQHVDLATLPEAPHRAVVLVVNELHERSAHALYRLAHPYFVELVASLTGLYHFGEAALRRAEPVIGPADRQVAAHRAELVGIHLPHAVDAEPADADETAALELFERPLGDFR